MYVLSTNLIQTGSATHDCTEPCIRTIGGELDSVGSTGRVRFKHRNIDRTSVGGDANSHDIYSACHFSSEATNQFSISVLERCIMVFTLELTLL